MHRRISGLGMPRGNSTPENQATPKSSTASSGRRGVKIRSFSASPFQSPPFSTPPSSSRPRSKAGARSKTGVVVTPRSTRSSVRAHQPALSGSAGNFLSSAVRALGTLISRDSSINEGREIDVDSGSTAGNNAAYLADSPSAGNNGTCPTGTPAVDNILTCHTGTPPVGNDEACSAGTPPVGNDEACSADLPADDSSATGSDGTESAGLPCASATVSTPLNDLVSKYEAELAGLPSINSSETNSAGRAVASGSTVNPFERLRTGGLAGLSLSPGLNGVTPRARPPAMANLPIPTIWRDEVDAWLRQINVLFTLNGFTTDTVKYNRVIAALDSKALIEVSELLENPPDDNKYEALIALLKKRSTDSGPRRLERALNKLTLQDRKPSGLFREMQRLAGNDLTDASLRSRWLALFPPDAQRILKIFKGNDTTTEDLLDAADQLLDQPIFLGVNACGSGQQQPASIEAVGRDSELGDLRALLVQLIGISRDTIEAVRRFKNNNNNGSNNNGNKNNGNNNNNDRNNFRNRRSRSKTPRPNSNNNNGLCYFHYQFGAGARNCQQPCTFVNPLPQQQQTQGN